MKIEKKSEKKEYAEEGKFSATKKDTYILIKPQNKNEDENKINPTPKKKNSSEKNSDDEDYN